MKQENDETFLNIEIGAAIDVAMMMKKPYLVVEIDGVITPGLPEDVNHKRIRFKVKDGKVFEAVYG